MANPKNPLNNPNTELKTISPSDDQVKDGNQDNSNIVMHLQQLASSLGINKNSNGQQLNNSTSSNQDNQIRFNKKLLDFDYGDDDEDLKGETPTESEPLLSSMNVSNSNDVNTNPLALSISQNLLSNPDLVQKLDNIANSSFFSSLNQMNNLNNSNDLTEQLSYLRDSLKQMNNNQNDQFTQLKLDKQQDKLRSSPNRRDKYGSNSKYSSSRRDAERSYRDSNRNDKSNSERDRRRAERHGSRERNRSHRSPKISISSINKKELSTSNYQQPTALALSPESKEKERERERRKKGMLVFLV